MKPFYFIDYSLLELKQDQSVDSKLDEYIRRLNEFKSSNIVQQFMESTETAQRPLTTVGSSTKTTIIIQLVGGWLQKTIMDLDKLLKVLFQDKTSVLSHLRISPGYLSSSPTLLLYQRSMVSSRLFRNRSHSCSRLECVN